MEDCIISNDTATTEFYTLSLHDALPICRVGRLLDLAQDLPHLGGGLLRLVGQGLDLAGDHRKPSAVLAGPRRLDRKSTRLNSSHANISHAVFCLITTTIASTYTVSTLTI